MTVRWLNTLTSTSWWEAATKRCIGNRRKNETPKDARLLRKMISELLVYWVHCKVRSIIVSCCQGLHEVLD